MLGVTIKPYVLTVVMLGVTINPFMLSVVMLIVVMLSSKYLIKRFMIETPKV